MINKEIIDLINQISQSIEIIKSAPNGEVIVKEVKNIVMNYTEFVDLFSKFKNQMTDEELEFISEHSNLIINFSKQMQAAL